MINLFKKKAAERYIDKQSKAVASFYAGAYRELIFQIKKRKGTLWQNRDAKEMLTITDEVIKQLDKRTRKFVEKEIPRTYFAFAKNQKKQLKKQGVKIKRKFAQIHTEAVQSMADDTYLKFANTMSGVQRSVQEYINVEKKEYIRKKIAEGMIRGETQEKIAEEIENMIENQGITSLIDRGGKRWQLDTYADMLSKTTLANAARDGSANTAREYGFDLVRITTHGATDPCRYWEGKIISLDGSTPGYPTLDEAIASGEIFHVNCRHNYFVTVDRK